jgi:putative DNA primase/helicase
MTTFETDGPLAVTQSEPVPITTDEGLARSFAEREATALRYLPQSRRWIYWDGVRWTADSKLTARWRAREFCRTCAKEQGNVGLLAARTAKMIEKLAESDPRLVLTADQLDDDPWLLNTPEGVIDLHNGELRAHKPENYITKTTSVAASGECPRWCNFLAEVTGGDRELQAFLQRLAGYVVSGSVREQVVVVLHGTGANGKSVFLDVLLRILGDYGLAASMDVFTASPHDRHPTELARLHGARLVTATETTKGRFWNEARLKQLTGGDRIAARFMRRDFFEFTPRFKIVLAGNELPHLASVTDAMRRRILIVPFAVTIAKEKRIPDLVEQLRPEWPGILKWAIEGSLEWQRIGLAPPARVRDATSEYFEGEDLIGQFIADRCETGPDHYV